MAELLKTFQCWYCKQVKPMEEVAGSSTDDRECIIYYCNQCSKREA